MARSAVHTRRGHSAPRTGILARVAAPALLAMLPFTAPALADDWLRGDDATGTWGGVRSDLDDKGFHVDLDYTAETFTRDLKAIDYRGNLDFIVDLNTEKMGLWNGGELLAFTQSDIGSGVSDELDLAMPVSNYEAQSFTQLSELWLYQKFPHDLALRLGKQDANRDFAAPRYPGNFLNSSYGVLPNTPLPSFPAPALGAALFYEANDAVSIRAGVYQGAPRVESFAGGIFDKGNGAFFVGAANFEVGKEEVHNFRTQLGGWHHTALDRSGLFTVIDHMIRFAPGADARKRSVQVFLRGSWDPQAHGEDADVYVGGGITAHGWLGENNTVGLGSGFVSVAGPEQAFVEIFYKWRPMPWFTVQPDLQVPFVGDEPHLVIGLRCKVKM